jgi:serine/threonine kinase PknH
MTMHVPQSGVGDRSRSDAPAGRAGRTRLLAGVIALAALVVLGTLGVALAGGPRPAAIPVNSVATSTVSTTSTTVSGQSTPSSSTASSTSATSTTPPTPPPPSPVDKLYGVLPPGYNSTLCTPSATPVPQALATVDCNQLDVAGGPSSAHFSLFPDANSLASQFQDVVNDDAVSPCPGSIDSPFAWHNDATPAFSAGSLVCGSHNDVANLAWTKNDVLLLGSVEGPDLDSLYGWWLSL